MSDLSAEYINSKNSGILSSIRAYLTRDKVGELLVSRGYISPSQLKSVLKLQKDTQRPLGQICIEQNFISSFDLVTILMRQRTLRFCSLCLLSCASLSLIPKKSYAGKIKDVPARILLASAENVSFNKIGQYPSLFGASEKRSNNLKAFTKWTGMFERFDRALNNQSSERIIHKLQAELETYKSKSIHQMAVKVNAMMNKKRYIVDDQNWGKSDYWATPIEFMERGGDCEDFAIAKYSALRAMGVPEDRMRIAIVQDEIKNIPHAILIVYAENGPVVLDNQIKEVREADSIAHYKPIFSINREAWWLHTVPQKASPTIVASAQ